jgi:hypothetical protein
MAIPSVANTLIPQSIQTLKKAPEMNYVFRIQELVNRILSQLSRFSEQSKIQSEALKKDYKFNSMEAARLQEKIGTLAPLFTGAVLLASGLHAGLRSTIQENSHIAVQTFTDLLPKLTDQVPVARDLYISRIQADQMRKQSKSALENTEIANEGQKSGEGSNFQQELLGLLNNVRESFKRVAG